MVGPSLRSGTGVCFPCAFGSCGAAWSDVLFGFDGTFDEGAVWGEGSGGFAIAAHAGGVLLGGVGDAVVSGGSYCGFSDAASDAGSGRGDFALHGGL